VAVIHAKPIEGARRQIETATGLLFNGGDVIAINTLVAAAGRTLSALADQRTTELDPVAFIRPGREEQFADLMDQTLAFFHYPDQDAASLLDGVQEEINDLMLFQCCYWYEALGNPLGRAMGAFTAWFVVMYQDLFVDNHPYKQRVAQENFDWLRDASRTQKLVFGQKLLMANRKEV
jgi:hypothetical protein